MNPKDNKRRLVAKIEALRDESVSEIDRLIQQKSSERDYEIIKILNRIKDEFVERMQREKVSVNLEYLDAQLQILQHEIKRLIGESDQDLFYGISGNLNRYIGILEEEKDKDEIEAQTRRQKGNTEYELEENKKKRGKDISWSIIPKIESYIQDVFSSTMKRLDEFNITISGPKLDELRYRILSEFKNMKLKEIENLLVSEDSQMIRTVNDKLEEFFYMVEQMRTQDEQTEGKSPNVALFEHFEIDHDLAQRSAEEKAKSAERRQALEELFK